MRILLLLLILSTNRIIWLQASPQSQETTTTVNPISSTPRPAQNTEGNEPEESVKVGSADRNTNCDQSSQNQEVVVIFVNRSDIPGEQQENLENTVSSNSTREKNTNSEPVLGSTFKGVATDKRNPVETKLVSAPANAGPSANDLDCTDTNNYETLVNFRNKLFPRRLKTPRIPNRIPSEPIACETLSDDEAALNQALVDIRRRIPRTKTPKRPQNLLLKRVYTPITTTHNEDLVSTPYRIENSNNKNHNNNIRYGYGKACIDNKNPNPFEQKRNRYPFVGKRAPNPRSRHRFYDCDYDSVEPVSADLPTLWNNCDSIESSENSKSNSESSESLDYLIGPPNFFT